MKDLTKNKLFQKAVWVLALLLIWELIARYSGISPLLMPDLRVIFAALIESLVHGTLLTQTLYSIGIIAFGILTAICIAVLLSLLSSRSAWIDSLVETMIAIMHPLPGLALMPLIIIWFGMGTSAVFVVIVHSTLWPILINLQTGMHTTPKIYEDVGRNFSMQPLQITWEIKFHASFAYLISGVKIGWARAWRALIAAEMVFGAIGKLGGIGWFILKKRTFMDTPGLYAGLIVVVIVGILIEELLFHILEKNTIEKWGMSNKS